VEVVILESRQEIASLAADAIEKLLAAKPTAVLGLATGSSPLALYDELVRRYQARRLSFAHARAFMLDEYVGLPKDRPELYRNVIEKEIASRVDFAPGAVQGPDGNAPDLAAACKAYDQAIRQAGGIDLQILGVGSDGHIAFNEPGSSLASRTRIKTLTRRTVVDNARFFEGDESRVPRHVVTQGLGTIMEARHLVLTALGRGKAEAVHQMVEGGVSSMWPASIIQFHPHASVLLDPEAASRLQLASYHRQVHAGKPDWQGL
jgi:glucosamine-6-phosphate deaminase